MWRQHLLLDVEWDSYNIYSFFPSMLTFEIRTKNTDDSDWSERHILDVWAAGAKDAGGGGRSFITVHPATMSSSSSAEGEKQKQKHQWKSRRRSSFSQWHDVGQDLNQQPSIEKSVLLTTNLPTFLIKHRLLMWHFYLLCWHNSSCPYICFCFSWPLGDLRCDKHDP